MPEPQPNVTDSAPQASNEPMVAIALEPAIANTDDDAGLVNRFLSGDAAAFDALYHRYFDKVYAIARGILIHHDECLDAVQEIFTLVYRHLNRFDRRSKFSTWLFRIAVNRSIQQARKLKFRHRETELLEAVDEAAPAHEDPPDPRIREALAKLTPADRAVLTLFYWEDLSIHEVAGSLGCSPNAAKTRLYRARERFKQVFEGED